MGLFSRFSRRTEESGPDLAVSLDEAARRDQLRRLEEALDALITQMQSDEDRMENPGWRGRIAEYSRAAAECGRLRAGALSREAILDLVFEIRPVYRSAVQPDGGPIAKLQDEVMALTEELRLLTPAERG